MISKQMLDWGANGNSIREIAAYGERGRDRRGKCL